MAFVFGLFCYFFVLLFFFVRWFFSANTFHSPYTPASTDTLLGWEAETLSTNFHFTSLRVCGQLWADIWSHTLTKNNFYTVHRELGVGSKKKTGCTYASMPPSKHVHVSDSSSKIQCQRMTYAMVRSFLWKNTHSFLVIASFHLMFPIFSSWNVASARVQCAFLPVATRGSSQSAFVRPNNCTFALALWHNEHEKKTLN